MKNILLISFLLFVFTGCANTGNTIGVVEVAIVNDTTQILWEETTYNNDTVIQPKNFNNDRTVRVWDLIVESPNSIVIGGIQNGSPFSTLSAAQFAFNVSSGVDRKGNVFNRDLAVLSSYNGSLFLGATNFNSDSGANSVLLSSNFEGDSIVLQKYNSNNVQSSLSRLANREGDIEFITSRINSKDTSNKGELKFGFYDNATVKPDLSFDEFTNISYTLILNDTDARFYKPIISDEYIAFRQLNDSETPSAIPGYTLTYCKTNNKCYIMRDDGVERRIVDAQGGSIHIDEKTYFNTSVVQFEHSSYAGNGTARVCFTANGTIVRGGC